MKIIANLRDEDAVLLEPGGFKYKEDLALIIFRVLRKILLS